MIIYIFSPKNLEVSKKVHIFAALKLKRVLEERDLIVYILEKIGTKGLKAFYVCYKDIPS